MNMSREHYSNEVEEHLKSLQNTDVPPNLDHYIQAGLEKGKKRRKRWDILKHSGLSAVAACILFILSVNYIPGFSTFAGKVPGLDQIVDRIQYDDGLKDALENNYVQDIDQTINENEFTFTVEKLVVDSKRLVLFYTLKSETPYKSIRLRDMHLDGDENSTGIEEFYWNDEGLDMQDRKHEGTIDINFKKEVEFGDQLDLSFGLMGYKEGDARDTEPLDGEFSMSISVDTSKIHESKTFMLNEQASLEDQTIHFKKLVSYPTREVLHLEYEEGNSMDIFHLMDIHLENEDGENVGEYQGGTFNGNERTMTFTGTYFQGYEQLYVVMSRAEALHKDKKAIVVDLKKEKLLKAPDDQISLAQIDPDPSLVEGKTAIHFNVETNENEQNRFVLASQYRDASGNKYHSNRQFWTKEMTSLYIDPTDYQNPLTFEVRRYPNYIYGDIRIKID